MINSLAVVIARSLKHATKTEGPRHDPYGVDVYTVTTIWRVAGAVDVRREVSLRRSALSGDVLSIVSQSKLKEQGWDKMIRHTDIELKSNVNSVKGLRERFEVEMGFGLHKFEEMKYKAGVANMAAHAGVSKREAADMLEWMENADRQFGSCRP